MQGRPASLANDEQPASRRREVGLDDEAGAFAPLCGRETPAAFAIPFFGSAIGVEVDLGRSPASLAIQVDDE